MTHVAPIITFSSIRDFEKWLEQNHTKTEGIWSRLFKKDSGIQSLTYAEALDVALCYGWIDGSLCRTPMRSLGVFKLPENRKHAVKE